MKGRYDMTPNASDYTTTECQVAGLDAVKYEGTYTFEITEEQAVGVTGYCILGGKTRAQNRVRARTDCPDPKWKPF